MSNNSKYNKKWALPCDHLFIEFTENALNQDMYRHLYWELRFRLLQHFASTDEEGEEKKRKDRKTGGSFLPLYCQDAAHGGGGRGCGCLFNHSCG